MAATPILLLGAGRMGGALIRGWSRVGAYAPADLIIKDPHPSDEARAAEAAGARLNPGDEALAEARTLLLAVKPQTWREAAAAIAPRLHADAVIVSIAAGVRGADIAQAFGGRRAARVMPTTGVAIAKGVASIFAEDASARAAAHALFDPVATTADIEDEAQMDAAVGVSGSAPAYLYAFIEALEAAGERQGLAAETARTLARATIVSAAALLDAEGGEPAELRRQVTSPGGTTAAALAVLTGEAGLGPLLDAAVEAAVRRSRELAG
ncbi:pyrroline-5-carboxylate reductase [Caulobacter sp. CCUG 60055]|uniref:pyrroline-5-carboxylate reductase n=1 Tax=Caulobacter sp. CCUG 60055 TaxID=2100090 RepID=UPI001FA6E3D0|nr:pyrroline-5-carboxylate reductase [Caulobacter sp. CCUG 60055]MCI3180653.1 pyrroline-5-carboxylate reductase [Caulobacter sp. CCUG 60055]